MPDSPAPRAHLLHRSVEPPVRHHPWLAVGVGLLVAGFAATGAALPMLLLFSGPDMTAYEGTWHDQGGATNMPSLRSDVAPAPALHLVEVLDGTSYLMIAPLPRADDAPAVLPPGADTPRLIGSTEEPRGAVAALETPPGAGAGWLGREVVLDNGCRARVTDLAIVAVMTGGTDYMAVEPRSRAADVAAALMRDGAPQVAAVLDGCAGSYAYPADQASPIVPVQIGPVQGDDELLAEARRRLFDSAPAQAANAAWREAGHSGTWQGHEYTEIETRAYRHPRTGTTTISVMANSDVGCGGANIQLWAIYELDADGAWHERVVTASSPLYTIEEALDLDGDGTLEWLGRAQLGDRLVVGVAGGEPVTKAQLEIPFFGCPC